MAFLIDTCATLWIVNKDDIIPEQTIAMLEKEGENYISITSLWEIVIKTAIGKLKTQPNGLRQLQETLERASIALLPIRLGHLEALANLPMLHRDPFDRLIIATALAENLTILTNDKTIRKYDAPAVILF
jgi:PIN domain nuclease of toxin-antitoxin system